MIRAFRTALMIIIIAILGMIVTVLMSSCNDQSDILYKSSNFRVRVIESGTISFVRITDELSHVYKEGDTVWVNMKLHRIDDVDTLTQKKCILTIWKK